MKIKFLNDELFQLIKQYVDPNATRKNAQILNLTFSQKFIKMHQLLEIDSSDSREIINDQLSKQPPNYMINFDIAPSFENHLRNKWMSLSSLDQDVDNVVKQTLEFYRSHYGATHFSILKLYDSVEFLHRLPRLLLCLEDCKGNIKEFSNRCLQLPDEWLLPSVLDLMTYPQIYTTFNRLHYTIPLHAQHSRFSILFFKEDGFCFPYWQEESLMNKINPDREDCAHKDVQIIKNIFKDNSAHQYHGHMANCINYLNQLLAYMYDWNNWLDDKGFCVFEKNFKAISLFRLIICSIIHNKNTTNQFMKLANTFRSLDLISNLIVALSSKKSTKHHEDNAFKRLFEFEQLVRDENLFYECNYFNMICKKISTSLNQFNPNHGTTNMDIYKEFRNHFTHGTFDNKEKRFNLLRKSPLLPYEINFMPILLLAILGVFPETSLKFFNKDAPKS